MVSKRAVVLNASDRNLGAVSLAAKKPTRLDLKAVIFQNFLGRMPPDPPGRVCFTHRLFHMSCSKMFSPPSKKYCMKPWWWRTEQIARAPKGTNTWRNSDVVWIPMTLCTGINLSLSYRSNDQHGLGYVVHGSFSRDYRANKVGVVFWNSLRYVHDPTVQPR